MTRLIAKFSALNLVFMVCVSLAGCGDNGGGDTVAGRVLAAIDTIDTTGFHGIAEDLNEATTFAEVSPRIQGNVEKALIASTVVSWPVDVAAAAQVFETDAQAIIDALVAEDLAAAQTAGDAVHHSQHELSAAAYEWLDSVGSGG